MIVSKLITADMLIPGDELVSLRTWDQNREQVRVIVESTSIENSDEDNPYMWITTEHGTFVADPAEIVEILAAGTGFEDVWDWPGDRPSVTPAYYTRGAR